MSECASLHTHLLTKKETKTILFRSYIKFSEFVIKLFWRWRCSVALCYKRLCAKVCVCVVGGGRERDEKIKQFYWKECK